MILAASPMAITPTILSGRSRCPLCLGGSILSGALLAINLGDDADTTGAVYGQLAGAFYGQQGMPDAWRARIVKGDAVLAFADRIFDLARLPSSVSRRCGAAWCGGRRCAGVASAGHQGSHRSARRCARRATGAR